MIDAIEIRRFTDKGIDGFRSYLADLRDGSKDPAPYDLLTNSETSQKVKSQIKVEQQEFGTRFEMARYLDSALAELDEDGIENDVHLWSWLSLFYFNQVCPKDKNGKRKPGRDYRHILEPGYPYGHRHLIGGAYLVYTVYGWRDDIPQLLLHTPPYVESKFNHELATRQSLITNRGIMEAAYKLYFDPSTKKGKRGAQIKKKAPGTLYRFIDVIQQLDLNFDLYSMTGDEIVSLLPPEFDQWK
jgi:hypothetical protein